MRGFNSLWILKNLDAHLYLMSWLRERVNPPILIPTLHYRSNHHPRTKLGIVKCLRTRARIICDDEEKFTRENTKLRDIFLFLNFPSYKIDKLLNIREKTSTRLSSTEEDNIKTTGKLIPGSRPI